MDSIERIGAFLGLAAFFGLAVLALLVIQQARDLRRLRGWAGKAPERAIEAAEESGEEIPEPDRGPVSGRLSRWGARLHDRVAAAWAGLGRGYQRLDRRSPIDPRALVAVLALAGVAAAALMTSGFGLRESERERGGGAQTRERPPAPPPSEIEVAVLNGTSVGGVGGVPGLASEIGRVVKDAGYDLGEVTDTDTSFVATVVMFEPGERPAARSLSRDIRSELGRTPVRPMIAEVRDLAGSADVALVLGQDDAEVDEAAGEETEEETAAPEVAPEVAPGVPAP